MDDSYSKEEKKRRLHPEAKGILFLCISLALFISLSTFIQFLPEKNFLGLVGYFLAWGLLYSFGLSSYLIALFVAWIGWKYLFTSKIPGLGIKALYFGIVIASSCVLLNLYSETIGVSNPVLRSRILSEVVILKTPFVQKIIRDNLGGIPAYFFLRDLPVCNFQNLLSNVGTGITFSMLGIVALVLFTQVSLIALFKKVSSYALSFKDFLMKIIKSFNPAPLRKTQEAESSFERLKRLQESLTFTSTPPQRKAIPSQTQAPSSSLLPEPSPQEQQLLLQANDTSSTNISTEPSQEIIIETSKPAKLPASKPEPKLKNLPATSTKPKRKFRLPPSTLLTSAKKVDKPTLKRELRRQAEILEETLASFGIEAKVGQINCGPTITSFDVHPAIGVKVQKIKALEDDIALNLQAKSIRIIAPIPGKAAVGVEIPSLYPQEVGFKEMLLRYQKQRRKFVAPILLGKTVTGEDVTCDLTKMPHCLIAGATGSGKSVCINTIVMSILMNATPEDVKLLLVDPKKVELSSYSALPHMIAPVITEPHGAYAALQWLVKEMQHRYEILKHLSLRNISSFNARKPNVEHEASLGIEIPEKMFYVVAIIDEFADLMMASSTDLETPIARIAQMARAVGIHLILATQRPSREVITGLIKANFPSRIAFKVSSRINSQIIIDENGAEALLGNGDLLFMPPGSSQLIRAQGAFIRDEDIHKIIEHCERQAHTNYLINSFDQMGAEEQFNPSEHSPKDSLYDKALAIVLATKTASTTFLQRKLKIGYARAASLVDELEENGVIGPQDGSRPRKVLISENPMGGMNDRDF